MNLEELMASTPPMQQHALIKGFQAGAASRDAEVAKLINAVADHVTARIELRAQINVLRDALDYIDSENASEEVLRRALQVLTSTPEQSLAEYRNKVIEDCAVSADALANCEEYTDGYRKGAALCAEAIRAMKEQP